MKTSIPAANNRWLRFIVRAVSSVAVLAGLTLLVAYASSFYAYHKAQKLVAEVRLLEPGKTSVDDVKRLVQRYGGMEFDAHSHWSIQGSDKKYVSPDPCLGEASSYSIYASPPLILTKAVRRFPVLQRLGLHSWSVSLSIDHKEGKVTCYSQFVSFLRQDGQEIEAEAVLWRKGPDDFVEKQPYEAMTFISRRQFHGTMAQVLPESSRQEKDRAFRVDLSCTVRYAGCYFPCQINPDVWVDVVREYQLHSWELPEGAHDPRCPAIY